MNLPPIIQKFMTKKSHQLHQKPPITPKEGAYEKKLLKGIEVQLMDLARKSIETENFIEASILYWGQIEQVLLPRLMRFIGLQLKLDLPPDIHKQNLINLNQMYFCLSHDKELYEQLEIARKRRNSIIHKMYTKKDVAQIQKETREFLKGSIGELFVSFQNRFTGKIQIPSVNLYRNGWNDSIKESIKVIRSL